MKVACDRCLKIEREDFINGDWLRISTASGSKYLFCKECADVFWKTMFNCDEKMDEKGGNSDAVDRR